jgi:glutathione peroxidase
MIMKKFLSILPLMFLFYSFTTVEDIYAFYFKTIEGRIIHLDNFKGKKILFVLIPVFEKDVEKIRELETFQNKYKDQVVIIGIPAVEEGLEKRNEKLLWKMYKEDRKTDIIICEPVHSKKAAGPLQSDVLRWLTDKEKNRRFNEDVRGVGHKFFVDEVGRLYAVMGPEISFTNPIIEKIMNKPKGY